MSSLRRMLAVLDLFTADEPVWTAEDLIARLEYSRPTGYRYVRELVAAGLLMRLTGGVYHLGPRIIELDRQIRATDPVLNAGQPIMKALAEQTGCHVLLASIYGERVLNIHHEPGLEKLTLAFARGVPMPLVRGATSKAILAYLPRARLKRVYEKHAKAIAQARLGRSWDEFRGALTAIRRQGYSYTGGELDPPNVGIAAPVFAADGEVLGSVSFVTLDKRWALLDQDQLVAILRDGARRITQAIALVSSPKPQRKAA
jgi:DNA-binding IclR family transcriptional regulator